jgi:hypothetical protein
VHNTIYDVPVFFTAPLVVNRTKSAAVPSVGACAKLREGITSSIATVSILDSLFFIFFAPKGLDLI